MCKIQSNTTAYRGVGGLYNFDILVNANMHNLAFFIAKGLIVINLSKEG
jgi:hypothetical protein